MQVSCASGRLPFWGAIFLFFAGAPVWAQTAATGAVSGLVTDPQGAAIPQVEVTLTNPATNGTLRAITNDAGRYIFPSVPPAVYNVTFSKQGFNLRRIDAQNVQVGQMLTLDAQMQVGSLTTVVEVSETPGAELQTVNATVGTTVNAQSIITLPIFGADASSLALIQPGVTPEGSVAGAMYDQNTFQLDGGNNSNDMDGSMRDYTGSFANNVPTAGGGPPSGVMPTSVESIEEFKVSTSGQTADFNGSSGSQIQMVTKRGTNSIHGSAYEYYFATDVGAANSWDNNHTPSKGLPYTPLPITHDNRFGAAIGGPIVPKNVLGGKWYAFFNYEGFRFPQSAIYTRAVPTATLRAGVFFINEGAAGYVPINLNSNPVTVNGVTYQPTTCGGGSCDPRGLGFNPLISQLWNKYMPLPNTNTGEIGRAHV